MHFLGQTIFLNLQPQHAPRRFLKTPCTVSKAVVLSLLALSGAAFAQVAPASAEAARQADVLRRQQEEQIQRDRELANPSNRAPVGADVNTLAPKPDASRAGPGCRDIDQIALNGVDSMSEADRVRIVQGFAGRCLGVPELEQLLSAITKYYIDRGLITSRAYLPAQDLKTGTLEITVVEGYIEKITLEEGERRKINPFFVFPKAGALLNLRDFEQGIEQLNKLPSNSASLDFRPGSQPGATEVVVVNKSTDPIRGSLSIDNQGSASTGRTQIGLTLSADGLFNLNELLTYTHRYALPNDPASKQSVMDSIYLAIPFGYSSLSFSGSRSRYASTITAPSGTSLLSDGINATQTLRFDRLLYRDQRTRYTVSSNLTRKATENFLAGQFLGVSSRILSVWDLDSSLTTSAMGGLVNVDLGYSRGLKSNGALLDPANLPDSAPRAQFTKIRYGLGFNRSFEVSGKRLGFNSQVTGQNGRDTLYGSEQMLIGGLYSVRGFVKNTLSGDSGYYARNDLSWMTSLDISGQKVPLRLYLGADFGRVSNLVPGIPQGALSGMALGAQLSFKHASLELIATSPLTLPDSMVREPVQYWATLRFNF